MGRYELNKGGHCPSLIVILGVGLTTLMLQSGSSLDIEGIGLLLLDSGTGDSTALYICSYWSLKLILIAGTAPENSYTITHTNAKTITITALHDIALRYKFLRI